MFDSDLAKSNIHIMWTNNIEYHRVPLPAQWKWLLHVKYYHGKNKLFRLKKITKIQVIMGLGPHVHVMLCYNFDDSFTFM